MHDYSYVFYEEHLDQFKKYETYLPFLFVIGSALAWNIFADTAAIMLIIILGLAYLVTFLARKAVIKIVDDQLQLNGLQYTSIAINDIKRVYLAERPNKGFATPVDHSIQTEVPQNITLPVSIPTYLKMKRGIIIEQHFSKQPWNIFVPSDQPELLIKAIHDAKQSHS